MLETHLRQVANALMDAAVSLAPAEFREWGQAMRGELDYVEGAWAAIVWAAGGVTVVAKQALIWFFMPARRAEGALPPGSGLFKKSVPLRKVALVAGAAYVLGALIFFAAPPFRQGLQVSLAAWNQVLHVSGWTGQPQLDALQKRAEARRDPEALVFVAARIADSGESVRLVEEAVRLDERMIWAYAIVAVRRAPAPAVRQWLSKLEAWDPQNALLYLIDAELVESDIFAKWRGPSSGPLDTQNNPAWQKAMAEAFASPKFDDYLDRSREVDRSVVTRYRFNDPRTVLRGEEADLPSLAYSDSQQFAKSILLSGQKLEAEGDVKGAAEKFWVVARFGQVIDAQARTGRERWTGTSLQALAYKQLQAVEDKSGNSSEAALFRYLAAKFDAGEGWRDFAQEEGFFGHETARRNAAVLQISSLAMLIFAGFMVIAVGVLIHQRRSSADSGAKPATPLAAMLGLASSVGVLLSCATVYLTYRPYWYIFQQAIMTGDKSQTPDLREFLMSAETLPGLGERAGYNLPVYFWALITLLCFTGLILILLRHFRIHTRANALHESSRVT